VEGENLCQRLQEILGTALDRRGRYGLRDWVFSTWEALEGYRFLTEQDRVEDIEVFFKHLDALADPNQLKQSMEGLYSQAVVSDPGAVQVMTIHKAKGLEFDSVILPGLGYKSLGEAQKLLLWFEHADKAGDKYLVLGPIQEKGAEDRLYEALRQHNKRSIRLEMMRLLYVAVTRAKKRLYWCSTEKDPTSDSLLSLLVKNSL
jgi:ATP-dependent exoDNAse (exonuclease V) beta subunit